LADFFADGYAFIAYLEGNERYARIFQKKAVVTSALNLLEVYSTLLRRISEDEARRIGTALIPLVVPVPPEVALRAGDFRRSMRSKRRDCSYVDAWGYASAMQLGVPFLTGDPAFRGIEHVSFVR
jgi:predicted nucleic acid-binding protein